MGRYLLLIPAVVVIALLWQGDGNSKAPQAPHSTAYYRMAIRGQVARFRDVATTIRRYRYELTALRAQRQSGTVDSRYAIRLAATAYGQSEPAMLRTANCESPGLNPRLVNRTPIYNGEHATGLFQFIPSTWRSTPYRHFNIFEPVANALAAGWMWANGRRGEWAPVCR